MVESLLDDDEVARFHRDGFLVVENVFSPQELVSFGAAVDAAVQGRAAQDQRTVGEKSLYEQSFIQCMNLWEDTLEVPPSRL